MYNCVLQPAETFNAGLYIRLSQEDRDKKYESESESIINQKDLLLNYVKTNGFNFTKFYIDDGFSGTDFERPGFQEMINDIEKGLINLVIVKDLSRLGRDHIMTGHYMENYFPINNVRFISILESYDSFKNQASNDTSTFIIAVNDYYSKQNSIKIRTVLQEKKKKGHYIGAIPAYGYMRDPLDKGHLIPDPEAAPIVKKIFEMASSGTPKVEIIDMLNNEGIETPAMRKKTVKSTRFKYGVWTVSTLRKILTNQMYCGDMVQNVQAKVNYKSKKKKTLDRSMWIIVENTHEALVSRKTFREVNFKGATRKINSSEREKRLFENLLVCKECETGIGVFYRKHKDSWTTNCNRYARNPRQQFCSSHFFPYNELEKQLLERVIAKCESYIKAIDIDEINEIMKAEFNLKNSYGNQLTSIQNEVEKLEEKLKNIYRDKVEGLIDSELFTQIQKEYQEKLLKKRNKLEQMKYYQMSETEVKAEIPNIRKKIEALIDIKNPTRELMFAIIDKIVIDQDRNIEIIYKGDILERDNFTYVAPTIPRNPYGRYGKKGSMLENEGNKSK